MLLNAWSFLFPWPLDTYSLWNGPVNICNKNDHEISRDENRIPEQTTQNINCKIAGPANRKKSLNAYGRKSTKGYMSKQAAHITLLFTSSTCNKLFIFNHLGCHAGLLLRKIITCLEQQHSKYKHPCSRELHTKSLCELSSLWWCNFKIFNYEIFIWLPCNNSFAFDLSLSRHRQ